MSRIKMVLVWAFVLAIALIAIPSLSAASVPSSAVIARGGDDGHEGGSGTLLLPPDQAQAAADTAPVPFDSGRYVISPQLAKALGSVPGVSVQTADGMTVDQAVGIAPVARRLAAASVRQCWLQTLGETWGHWPYQQRVYAHASWCGVANGIVTYKAMAVTTQTFLCDNGGTFNLPQGGGVGYTFFAQNVGGYFSCPTNIPWISYHFTRCFTAVYNTSREAVVTSTSCDDGNVF